jgi:hypothetical protein
MGSPWSVGPAFLSSRCYDHLTGRFLNEDLIGYADDINLYRYARNNPVNASDPSGQQSQGFRIGFYNPLDPDPTGVGHVIVGAGMAAGEAVEKLAVQAKDCLKATGRNICDIVERLGDLKIRSLGDLVRVVKPANLKPTKLLATILELLKHPCLKLIPGYTTLYNKVFGEKNLEKIKALLALAEMVEENPDRIQELIKDSPILHSFLDAIPGAMFSFIGVATRTGSAGVAATAAALTQNLGDQAVGNRSLRESLTKELKGQAPAAPTPTSKTPSKSLTEEIFDGICKVRMSSGSASRSWFRAASGGTCCWK